MIGITLIPIHTAAVTQRIEARPPTSTMAAPRTTPVPRIPAILWLNPFQALATTLPASIPVEATAKAVPSSAAPVTDSPSGMNSTLR